MRINIFHKGKLIGQDYQRENGEWMHKWMREDGKFERGGWRGRCEGEDSHEWEYVEVPEE